MKKLNLPVSLHTLLYGQGYTIDDVGLSDSKVLIFTDKVLKIRKRTEETDTEFEMLQWLKGKLPVPQVIYHEVAGKMDHLLMTRINGSMACDEAFMTDPVRLTQSLAKALKLMWSVDISDCPADWRLDRKLIAAEKAVAAGEVDVDNTEPETFGEDGFCNPKDLLDWLIANRPEEDLVLSHGDFCLPNVFLYGDSLAGIIDLGRAGVADRWQDIALCYRSLKHNFAGKYGKRVYDDYDPELLFAALDIEPDWKKLKYYILLDELF